METAKEEEMLEAATVGKEGVTVGKEGERKLVDVTGRAAVALWRHGQQCE